ncbi:MAG: beta-galactosidase [Armatimonadota bacterium]|nr:beta-galactosidase [Armatimonadota bacterium]
MRRTARLLALTLCIALTWTSQAAEQTRPLYDEIFFEPTEAVQTPHIAWAKPYYRGPIRALFITHRDAMREVVELAQRVSLDYRVLAMEKRDVFAPGAEAKRWQLVRGNSHEELADRLRGYLQERWDVIVLGNIKWDEIPIDCRYLVLAQVSEGTGLVGCVVPAEYEYLDRIMASAKFHWHYYVWTGEAQGIEDYFGEGEFEGTVVRENPHSGEACARIVGIKAEPGSRGSPYAAYHQKIAVEPDTDYRFSAWYRSTDFAQGRAWISVLPVKAARDLEVSHQWDHAAVEFNSGEHGEVTVYLFTRGLGTVWYDDVRLARVGDETNLVPNPGFEQPGADAQVLARGLPFRALPAFSAYDSASAFARGVVQATEFHDGRIALLQGIRPPGLQMMTPSPGGDVMEVQPHYDYYLALAARTILWGADKEPEARLSVPGPEPASFERAALPADLSVGLAAERDFGDCRLRVEVRDHAGELWHEATQQVAVAQGEQRAALELPRLARGEYLASVWLTRGEEVIDFATAAVAVEAEARLEEVALDRESFSRSEPVTGRASVAGAPGEAALVLTVRDNFGRQLERAVMEVEGAEPMSFSLETLEPLSIVSHLRVELRAGDELLDVARIDYSVSDLHPDPEDVRHVMWQSLGNDFISRYIAREFYEHGIDTQYTGFSPIAPHENLWHLPYATRFVDRKTDWYQPKKTRAQDDHVRDPCLTDPEYRAQVREKLTTVAERAGPYSTSDFSLGDENHFVAGNYDLCFSETCVADFRDWCEREYETIGALNAEWGTDYPSFAEVEPITLEQAEESGRYAQWVDHRRHMESVWAGIHAFSRDVIREVVPEARVGYEGSDVYVRSLRAADYWKLSRAMDLNNIYYRDFVSAAWHDFAQPGTLLGAGWFGGYTGNRNEAHMRWFPWRSLLKGSNSFWVWMGHSGAGGVMAPDLSLYPFFEAACEEIKEFKRGIGKLLITAERQHDGIALLYSPSSVHVAHVTPEFPSMHDELNDAVKLIHDIGLECRVLSYEQVEEGALSTDEFRVVLLAGAQALSEREAEAIERFASDGGTVIADLRPGVTDEHGKAREAGALDELLGVRLSPEQFAPAHGDLVLAEGAQGVGLPETLTPASVVGDTEVEVAGGRPLGSVGEAPALITHEHGAGRTMLLNFGLAGYSKLVDAAGREGNFAGWADGGAWRTLLSQAMDWAGVAPPVRIEPPQPHVEISRFRAGEIEYVGILQGLPRPGMEYTNRQAEIPEPVPVTVHLGRRAHLYDVRAGRHIGERDRLTSRLQPGRAHLYALLPYEVSGVELRLPDTAAQGEQVSYVARIAAGGDVGRHVIHVTVTGPDGAERAWYARNLRADGGRAVGGLPFALDDQPGTWTIRATDVATGATATRELELSAE